VDWFFPGFEPEDLVFDCVSNQCVIAERSRKGDCGHHRLRGLGSRVSDSESECF